MIFQLIEIIFKFLSPHIIKKEEGIVVTVQINHRCYVYVCFFVNVFVGVERSIKVKKGTIKGFRGSTKFNKSQKY